LPQIAAAIMRTSWWVMMLGGAIGSLMVFVARQPVDAEIGTEGRLFETGKARFLGSPCHAFALSSKDHSTHVEPLN
jgi:hypothetical protein